VERKDVSDRQLEALLERLDAIQAELARINRRLEANEGVVLLAGELRTLNESLNAIAYAALGQSPQVRRRRAG
jgi:predicted hotdog family 3-hydroxylacyl-ACP dehydratase